MTRLILAVLGLAAILSLLCAFLHRDAIETDLLARSSASLSDAGFGHLELAAAGRDLVVRGVTKSAEEKQLALEAAKVYGVRVARDEIGIQADHESAAGDASPSDQATSNLGTAWMLSAVPGVDNVLEWNGALGASSLEEFRDDAAPFFDPSGLTIESKDDGASLWTPTQRAAVKAALPFLAAVPSAALDVSPQRLSLRGTPRSLRQAQAVRRALAPRMPEDMDLELTWDRPWTADELSLEIAERDGSWDLSGLVPKDSAESWAQKARDAKLEPLDVALIEADLEAPPGFGVGFEGALNSLEGLPGARLVESRGSLDFSGLSDDADLAKRLEASLRTAMPEGTDLRFSVAPKLEAGACQSQLESELLAEKILFASGSANLDAKSDALLRRLSTTLRRCPDKAVRIEGHTDSDGDDAFNQTLSTRRADAVKRRMVALGVDPLRLEAQGYGETRPIAEEDSAEAKSRNRRIEFVLKEDA